MIYKWNLFREHIEISALQGLSGLPRVALGTNYHINNHVGAFGPDASVSLYLHYVVWILVNSGTDSSSWQLVAGIYLNDLEDTVNNLERKLEKDETDPELADANKEIEVLGNSSVGLKG
ncbi:hypothetical protein K435DRAFT_790116 [Dendrothele bispora CBS 962.96]|uniref:Uncharacterized protein n=1 Tax=Dendrothele bispora (strain CBS 962.96) TaxID=1314807 RepID=A0A4S8MRH9_DENBC|nr:hypothetical protein K435DRAFT_790116 [Dendrothele bispora CBS 962.96]